MMELEDLARAAGLDPDSPDYQLRQSLAEADDELLEELVRMRKAKGFTQQDVAERMKRNKSAVCNFERLSADPHLSTIRRYAAAIGAHITHNVADFDLLQSSDYDEVEDDRIDDASPANGDNGIVFLTETFRNIIHEWRQSATTTPAITWSDHPDVSWATGAGGCLDFKAYLRGGANRSGEERLLAALCSTRSNG